MNKLVSRMNYCFFAMVVAALMGLVHMGLRAANSMPLSEVSCPYIALRFFSPLAR